MAVSRWSAAAEFTWTGGGAGFYSDPLDWSPGGPPAFTDRANFKLTDNITFSNSPSTGNALVTSAATVAMFQSGNQVWTIGGELRAEGQSTLALHDLDVNCVSLLPSNGASVNINSGASVSAQTVALGTTGTPGDYGLINIDGGGVLSSSAQTIVGGAFQMRGTLNFGGGEGTLANVQIGHVVGGGNASLSGALMVASGGQVTQNIGEMNIGASAEMGQAGSLLISNATSVYRFSNATAINVGAANRSAGSIVISDSGRLDITDAGAELNIFKTGTVTLGAATLSTLGDININGGAFICNGGSLLMSSGKSINVTNGGGFSSNLPFALSPGVTLNVNNARATSLNSFDIGTTGGTGTANLSGATLALQAASVVTWGSGTSGFARVDITGQASASINGSLNVGINGGGASITIGNGQLIAGGTSGITVGGGTSSQQAVMVADGFDSLIGINTASSTNVNARGVIRLTNGGQYVTNGHMTINGGSFDASGGSLNFQQGSYLLNISNNGGFLANNFSTSGKTANVTVASGGQFLFNGAFNFSGGTATINGPTSLFAANVATFTSNRTTIQGGGAASFNSATIGPGGAGTSIFNVNGPSTLRVNSALTIGPAGVLNLTGAGSIAGSLTNQGIMNFPTGGVLNVTGQTTNNGAMNFTGQGQGGNFANIDGTGSIITNSTDLTVNRIRQSLMQVGPEVMIVTRPNGGDSGVSRINEIEFDISPALDTYWDLNDNDLVIDYTGGSPASHIRAQLVTGHNGGDWQGNGLRSTSASSDRRKALGYGENSSLGYVTFSGQSVDSTSVLVKFTFYGDADLDGDVDIADLGRLATNWQTSNAWTGGDFDYSGSVNVNDLGLLASNWQAGVGSPLGPSFSEALASVGLPSVSVPEPGVLGLAIAVAVPCNRRRRRSKR
jgi:hypothetical protein